MRLRDPAELERDATEHQCQQHHDERHVERRHHDRVSGRERHEQAVAAEDEPRLVAIPERRDRVHHPIAVGFARKERKQDADAEIESVEDHVQRDGDGHDAGADERQPERRAGERFGRHIAEPPDPRFTCVECCAVASGRLGSA